MFFSVSFVVFLLMFCLLVLPYYVVNKDEYIMTGANIGRCGVEACLFILISCSRRS